MKLAIFLIAFVLPLAAVVIGLLYLFLQFLLVPFGTTGLTFFVLAGGLAIFGILGGFFVSYFHFIVRQLEKMDTKNPWYS